MTMPMSLSELNVSDAGDESALLSLSGAKSALERIAPADIPRAFGGSDPKGLYH